MIVAILVTEFLINGSSGFLVGEWELGAVLIILVVTAHPRSLWAVTGGAILLGLQMAYSHEYGFACLAAMIGMYGVMAVRREGWWTVLSAAVLAVGSGLTWFTAARLLMGDSFSAYLTSSLQLLGYFSQGGERIPVLLDA